MRAEPGSAVPAVPPTPAVASGNSCPLCGLPLVTLDPGVPSKATVLWFCGKGSGLVTGVTLSVLYSRLPPLPPVTAKATRT